MAFCTFTLKVNFLNMHRTKKMYFIFLIVGFDFIESI
jgi:hypothetical protein